MRIGEQAAAVSVPAKTIRYYEAIGLLPVPLGHANGYRSYDPSAGERLRFVKAAQAVGFTLTEIKEIPTLRDAGEEPCAHVLDMVTTVPAALANRSPRWRRCRPTSASWTPGPGRPPATTAPTAASSSANPRR